jgi:hypothetical protein
VALEPITKESKQKEIWKKELGKGGGEKVIPDNNDDFLDSYK